MATLTWCVTELSAKRVCSFQTSRKSMLIVSAFLKLALAVRKTSVVGAGEVFSPLLDFSLDIRAGMSKDTSGKRSAQQEFRDHIVTSMELKIREPRSYSCEKNNWLLKLLCILLLT